MQAKLFLAFNGLIVAVLVLRLILVRQKSHPTPLSMDGSSEPLANFEAREKVLNCYFQFNGMMLDAFEVLGVPAGSDREACYRAYIDLKKRAPQSPDLIEKAWDAVNRK